MGDIFRAAREGNEEEVTRLLDVDPALLERGDDRGDRPLTVAALSRQLRVTRLLIERGANIHARGIWGNTALHHAARWGYEEVLALLLREGAHACSRDDDGTTPLMGACRNGHLGVVKMLVQHMGGRGLNDRNDRGWTALHFAAEFGHDEVVRFLLLAGADPTITEWRGMTPRAFAEQNDDSEMFGEECARCVAVFQVRPRRC
jgi:serine/threonine-protein phosphatase 6 regulatory ankyrin repeat subunit B